MSSLLATRDSVVPSSDQIAQATNMGFEYADGSSFRFPTGGSPTSYPNTQPYSHQNVAHLRIPEPEGASNHEESMESFCSWVPFLSTPRAATSPRVATTDVLQPSRRRAQQAWTPSPDGTLCDVSTALLPNHSTVVDSQRSVSDPTHGSHVLKTNGTTEASRRDLPSVPRTFSGPCTLDLAASYHQITDESPVFPSGLSSAQQPAYAPQSFESWYHNHLAAKHVNAPDDDLVEYGIENQVPLVTPSMVRCPQASQPPKDQNSVESSIVPGLDVSEWAPPYGQRNVDLGPEPQQNFRLQEGVNRKRGREVLDPFHVDEDGNIVTEYQDHSPIGFEFNQSPGEFDEGPGIEEHHRSVALPWNADDLDDLPRSKRRRLGNGHASLVGNTSPKHVHRPSMLNGQQIDPDSLSASVTPPLAAPNPRVRVSPRPKKSHRAVKKRISRSVKQRSHGDLALQADGTFLFRESGKDDWEPTTYHEDMREEMIEEMNTYGEYDDPPACGPEKYDQTAFEPTQAEWTFSGHQGWHPSQDWLMYRFERRDHRDPNYEPGPLRFQGYVILNKNHEVITGWRDMPLTISSSIEGGRIENIQRTDGRIAIEDFQDRMIGMVSGKPVQGRSAFTNRTMRYRLENGLASWSPRDGSLVIKKIMLRHLTPYQLDNNSTKGYAGLTDAERAEIRNNNERTGRYKSRAGKKALPRN